jgi:hypothetical protein
VGVDGPFRQFTKLGISSRRELKGVLPTRLVGGLYVTREQVASPRDELLDGLRGSAGDFLDRGGHAVIPILAMEPGHGRDVLIDVRSEVGACEHLIGPRFPRDVDVGNRSAQGAGVLFGDAGTSQIVESRSIVIGPSPGPAPTAHARRRVSAMTSSS